MYADLSGGFEFISDTAAHTGRFSKVYFKEDTVISRDHGEECNRQQLGHWNQRG